MTRRITAGRDRSSVLVGIAASRIEEQLLQRRHGGFGVDLDTDPDDPTKADLVLALAAERLVKKYGEQLVIARYRHRVTISWRASAFAALTPANKDALNGVGFFGGPGSTLEELRTGSNALDVGHPNDPHFKRRIDAARRHRVATWTAEGWSGDAGWADAGGTPADVGRLREHMRPLVREGKINIGGKDVQWKEPSGVLVAGGGV